MAPYDRPFLVVSGGILNPSPLSTWGDLFELISSLRPPWLLSARLQKKKLGGGKNTHNSLEIYTKGHTWVIYTASRNFHNGWAVYGCKWHMISQGLFLGYSTFLSHESLASHKITYHRCKSSFKQVSIRSHIFVTRNLSNFVRMRFAVTWVTWPYK